jgi:hypothetical protein
VVDPGLVPGEDAGKYSGENVSYGEIYDGARCRQDLALCFPPDTVNNLLPGAPEKRLSLAEQGGKGVKGESNSPWS